MDTLMCSGHCAMQQGYYNNYVGSEFSMNSVMLVSFCIIAISGSQMRQCTDLCYGSVGI